MGRVLAGQLVWLQPGQWEPGVFLWRIRETITHIAINSRIRKTMAYWKDSDMALIRNRKSEIGNSGIRNRKFGIRNRKFGIRNQESEIRYSESGIGNRKFGIRNQVFGNSIMNFEL